MAQFESLAMMAAGAVWLYAVRRRHGTLGGRAFQPMETSSA
jgi:hypothetical protein